MLQHRSQESPDPQRFQLISNAYEVLGDEESRSIYDSTGRAYLDSKDTSEDYEFFGMKEIGMNLKHFEFLVPIPCLMAFGNMVHVQVHSFFLFFALLTSRDHMQVRNLESQLREVGDHVN